MPFMVYLLGIPTHIAIGTDLFEIVVSAGYGSFRHAMNGNVDVLIALIMQTGASIGAQIGAILTQYFNGPRIRIGVRPAAIDRRGPDYLQLGDGTPHALSIRDGRCLPFAGTKANSRLDRQRYQVLITHL